MNMLFLLSLKKDKSNQTALNFKKETLWIQIVNVISHKF